MNALLGGLEPTHCCAWSYKEQMDTRFDGIAEFVAVTRLGSFTAVAAEKLPNRVTATN